MTDELDKVVRGLEAERYRPSRWWSEKDLQALRRRQLEAALIAVERKERQAAE